MKEDAKRLRKIVGRRIRERRADLDLSREALAELIDVSNQYVAKCESGSQNVTIGTLVKFANALQTTVVSLLTPTPKKALVEKTGSA